ncbi:transporter substrate-binding domain-containing protein [Mesorhizobium microcysteis]|uniref:Transporter substrate-binding domain-containing protein n=1 Tax=Neoaquamicrobium microcysteis TaxID=2682781 RepID=A0A5D4GM52_9HYPH|nr:transporter substrate-binding domain-containing protein [Mesorhizobium microcysteis]TYR29398.1 transporter substrate-binding domain-containing protein [Mesorhizobium microcysteis]
MLKTFKALFSIVAIAACLATASGRAAEPVIPNYWDERERLPKPDLSGLERLRFLTTIDFPPFSFLDGDGRLSGFHVELARAICRELDIVARCQIQALPWDELDEAMANDQGEALIAGTSVTADTRERYVFSRPYLRFPARFAVRRTTTLYEPLHKAVADRRIGVLAGSGHEAMLRSYFPDARPVTFTRLEWLHDALREGRVDGIFGDGMRLSFWIAGSASQNCCRFAGGPYIAPEFLGAGLAIAANKDDAVLAQAFDYALREIAVKGTFAELYLKYFPVSFY